MNNPYIYVPLIILFLMLARKGGAAVSIYKKKSVSKGHFDAPDGFFDSLKGPGRGIAGVLGIGSITGLFSKQIGFEAPNWLPFSSLLLVFTFLLATGVSVFTLARVDRFKQAGGGYHLKGPSYIFLKGAFGEILLFSILYMIYVVIYVAMENSGG